MGRLQLQTLLESITDHVYFQPPSNVQMEYPCIVYQRDDSSAQHADNHVYRNTKRYQVTVIDRNPDSEIPDVVESIPMSAFDRFFIVDNLNHYVFHLFFS